MKSTLFLIPLLVGCVVNAQQKDYPIQPVPFNQVKISDNFWKPKLDVNANVTIPTVLRRCKEHGTIENFVLAAKKTPVTKYPTDNPYDESDLYKIMEGASYSLQNQPNPQLKNQLDSLISIIAAAQENDGYLFTFRSINIDKPHEWIGSKRWEKEELLSHELYDCGHLFDAAVAHYQATGQKNFLDIALKNADLLVKTFGKGKEEKFPGHQGIETGLTKLYRITGKKEYLTLAKFLLDLRGKKGHENTPYNQSEKPVNKQTEAMGHAVRAAYMYMGMAEIVALMGDNAYSNALDAIWKNVVNANTYITGGVGVWHGNEGYATDYDLTNMGAYSETCASIANIFWNNRMFLLNGDAKYIDILERTLYNALLSGVSLSGDRFYYPNALASAGQNQRSEWLSTACCISNITRFLPSMPGYVYAQNGNNLYVNLFIGSSSVIKLPAANINITQNTNLPWEGKNEITINPDKNAAFTVRVRIPGWANNQPIPSDLYTYENKTTKKITILVNGTPATYTMEKGYAVLNRTWLKGDKITLDLPMDIQKVIANNKVVENNKKFALQMGPIVYCLEGPDNTNGKVLNTLVDKNATVTATFKPNLLNGVMTLQTKGISVFKQSEEQFTQGQPHDVLAIPYYAWANRSPSEMMVWIPYDLSKSNPIPTVATIASKSKVTSSVLNDPLNGAAVNDRYDPLYSHDRTYAYLEWPIKDSSSTEWVQYDFDSTYTVSESKVYWFEDYLSYFSLPQSWKLYYKKGNNWVPVKNTTKYGIELDKYNAVKFEPVTTTALRLELKNKKYFATGLYEWIVKKAVQNQRFNANDDLAIKKAPVYLMPNPTTQEVRIVADGEFSYLIYTTFGTLVEKGTGTNTCNAGGKLMRGTYTVIVKTADKNTTLKFIKM